MKTWIFRILINLAKTRGRREARSIPFSSLWDPAEDLGDPAVDPARFLDARDAQWPHHWATPPHSWGESPEDRLLSDEGRAYIDRAIETLTPSQREVITFRDVQGWTSKEVCALLGITPVMSGYCSIGLGPGCGRFLNVTSTKEDRRDDHSRNDLSRTRGTRH